MRSPISRQFSAHKTLQLTAQKLAAIRESDGYIHHHRRSMDRVGRELRILHLDDWYYVDTRQVAKRGIRGVLQFYNVSLLNCLAHVYPTHKWIPWRFKHVPPNFWKCNINRREKLEDIAKERNFKHLDDWYTLGNREAIEMGAGGIMSYFNMSIAETLASVYPHHDWLPWRFNTTTIDCWRDYAQQRLRFDLIAKNLGLKQLEDWYNVVQHDVITRDEYVFMKYHNGSMSACLAAIYPTYDWKPWKFKCAPRRFWDDVNNQRGLFTEVEEQNNIKTADEWRDVPLRTVEAAKGMLQSTYGGSLQKALMTVYSHMPWMTKDFFKSFWQIEENQRAFLLKIKSNLDITSPSMWYRVSQREMQKNGASGLFRYWPHVLSLIEPNIQWHWTMFSWHHKASKQRVLMSHLNCIFPPVT